MFWRYFWPPELDKIAYSKDFFDFQVKIRTRVSQICSFLSTLKIDVDPNFFPLFRLKVLQKTKVWKISCIFWPGPSRPKFYYITHLCEIKLSRKFNFFIVGPCIFFKNLNSKSKMCSFEIQYVGVAQIL